MDRPACSYVDPVAISVPALVRLAEPAAALPVMARTLRARHGGAFRSPFKGRGMEFDEVRPYEPGDDIRTIDWKVTARSGEPFTKLFREERERPVLLAVDLRAPMFFATRRAFKAVVAAYAATLLAWSAARSGDRVGALVFADAEHRELKPQRGRAAVLHFIQQLAAHPAWSGARGPFRPAALGEALARLRRVTRPGSLVFVLSDFRGFDGAELYDLVGLGRHNDVMLVQIHDPVEAELPARGRCAVTDGRRRIEIETTPQTRDRYAERFRRRRDALRAAAHRARVHHLAIATADELFPALQAGLRRRPR